MIGSGREGAQRPSWLDDVLETALELSRRAGAMLLDVPRRPSSSWATSAKPDRSLVTDADLAIARMVEATIADRFPEHRVLTEESEDRRAELDAGVWWVVDPVDGTTNLVHGRLDVATSVAVAVDGRVQVGVVVAPFRDEEFLAVRGRGALRNGHAIEVSKETALDRALVASGFPHDRGAAQIEEALDRFRVLLTQCRDVRRTGCPVLDLCDVAAGRFDAWVETVCPWDIAAAGLVATEAGALRSHLGDRQASVPAELDGRRALLATPGIHADLRNLLSAPAPD